MPEPLGLMSSYFWVIAILVSFVNVAMLKVRSRPHIERDPALEPGYETLVRGYLTWMNVPWIVMGFGMLVGGVPSVWHFFQPRSGNPYVLAWFGSVFLLWGVGTYWLLRRGGAELLATHPGFFNQDISSPAAIKWLWFACLAGGVAGVAFMLTQETPFLLLR